MEITYSKAFFDELERAMDKSSLGGYQKCRQCGSVDGEYKIIKKGKRDGYRSKLKAVVRLALIDPDGPVNVASNIGYYCTKCRKPPREFRPVRKMKPSALPQLF